MISLRNVSKSFDGGATWAVRDVSFVAAGGEFLVLLGGSGCGKTTTLRMINRLTEPTSGAIVVDGRPVAGRDPVALRRSIGYVFQGIGLFPHMSVGANIGVTPRLLGWPRRDIERRVDELLELVGLSPAEHRDRPPRSLSGGQRQRVGVARALAARPSIMLMDEPLGALDPITRDGLQTELARLHKALGLTIVMVTHDMMEALLLADRIGVMRDGRLVQLDPPGALLRRPADPYVAELVNAPKRQADRLESLAGAEPAS